MTFGLHHVTAISGPAQATVDFYSGALGLRLVKRTVNFDDPGTYHLYYADGDAAPGSVLTFFPWAADALRGRPGQGQTAAFAYAVGPGAADAWADRLTSTGVEWADGERFGERVLSLRDPDGLAVEIVEVGPGTAPARGAVGGGWAEGPVDASMALGAFHSVTLCSAAPWATQEVLVNALGYQVAGAEDGRTRLVNPAAERAGALDLFCAPGDGAARMGVGTVHHVAFRVPDREAQQEVRRALLDAGLRPTDEVDRQYFRSVYAREPGGILFEIATDPPGFAVDEPADALGESLMLPPQYESSRAQIEARLPTLTLPSRGA